MTGWLRRLFGQRRPGREAGRAYHAAAKATLASGGWAPADPDARELAQADGALIRARARQLVRDLPAAAAAVRAAVDLVVGDGIEVEPRPLGPDGRPLAALGRRLGEAWTRWQEEADASGRLHFAELQQLVRRSEAETGEGLVVLRELPGRGRWMPLALQVIEPDRLTTWAARPAPGNELSAGVEYDPATGRVVAYWIDDGRGRSSRVPAERVVHTFAPSRPGQLRGISPLAPAVLLAHSLRDYIEAHMDGARMAAKWLAFVTSPSPEASMLDRGAYDDPEFERRVEEVGNAMIDYLAPGEDVKFAEANRPGDAFAPFVRFLLQSFATATGLTYELVSGDYAGLNYSTLRGIRNDLADRIRKEQSRFSRRFLRPVYRAFVDWAVVTGRVNLPGYWAAPERFRAFRWIGPGLAPVDPLKEAQADAAAVAALLKSPQEAIRARGGDPADVLDQIKEFRRMAAERGLVGPAPAPTAEVDA